MSPPGPEGDLPAVRDVLVDVARRLGSASEARWILEYATGRNDVQVLARTGARLPVDQADTVASVLERRLAGHPLQYLLGRWAFRSLDLAVDPRVLIPRPETELVAGHALDELRRSALAAPTEEPVRAADLGTGSGAIALTLAAEGPPLPGGRDLEVWAADRSPGALEVAAANEAEVRRAQPGLAPVHLVEGSWFGALPPELAGTLTLVVSNPPYVTEAEWTDLDPVVRDHEPYEALVSGPSGTEDLDAIMEEAPRWLAPWGVLVLELAPHQADGSALRALVDGFDGVLIRNDLAGRARTLVARRSLET